MKKFLLFLVTLAVTLTLSACGSEAETLYVLNWGDYINEEVVIAFEEEYGVTVVMDEVDSNESMYERIKNANTAYDIAVPSDYMVEKLNNEGLLNTVPSVDAEYFAIVDELTNQLGINDVASPYFWGSLGIIYNVEYQEIVEEYSWGIFFEDVLPTDAKIGMYNSARDALAVALLYLGYSVNTTDVNELTAAEALLAAQDYDLWGDDNLKTEVVAGNLDAALVYSGDYFDQYYILLEEGGDETFAYYAPLDNNLWIDFLVIPTTSENTDLAETFITFMSDHENALWNVDYVGYAPPIESVYNEMVESGDWDDIVLKDSFLNVFISPDFNGEMYRDLGSDYSEQIEGILNRVKQD